MNLLIGKMVSLKTFKKRSLLVLGLLLYAGLWLLTQWLGAPDVRNVALQAMHIPAEVSELSAQKDKASGNVFCSSRAYAPFLIRADYGWQKGPLYGDGGSALYLWFFGLSFRIVEMNHWMS